jgi:hypothetical protein
MTSPVALLFLDLSIANLKMKSIFSKKIPKADQVTQ